MTLTKERLKSPRARLFVALELPAEARKALGEWQRDLEGRAPGELRPVAGDALHMTLVFIGYAPERDIEKIAEAVAKAVPAGEAIDLTFAEELRPKPPRRPKFYAAEIEDADELRELRAGVAAALTETRLFEDERREFWPHVTLARVKRSATEHRPPHPLPGAPRALTETTWPALAVTLFRSHLEPSGARYERLLTVKLGASA